MVKDNILKVRSRIHTACSRANRDPQAITLVAISKGRDSRQIEEALDAGITDIGENKVQEALLKYNNQLTNEPTNQRTITWHMVGHLQTNKVKDAVRIFDLIHSVDSIRLAQEIDKQAAKIGKVQDILIEVKTSPEETKSGIDPVEAAGLIQQIASLKHINTRGLMTIAALSGDPEKARPYFRRLRELKEEINNLQPTSYDLQTLSMGMTDDFEVAIEEGANMVRIGRAIFEG